MWKKHPLDRAFYLRVEYRHAGGQVDPIPGFSTRATGNAVDEALFRPRPEQGMPSLERPDDQIVSRPQLHRN